MSKPAKCSTIGITGDNPNPAAGLWYTGSMGPTQPDGCLLCPATMQTPNASDPNNWCCQGCNFGTGAGYGYGMGNTVGMFGRYHKSDQLHVRSRDGLSNTIMVGETMPRTCVFVSAFAANFNISPTNVPINTANPSSDPTGWNWWLSSGFKSMHPGGANFAMGDGSVMFFSETIDFKLYNNLGTRAGGEIVQPPE